MKTVVGPSRSDAKEGKEAPNTAQDVTVSQQMACSSPLLMSLLCSQGQNKTRQNKGNAESGRVRPYEEPEVPVGRSNKR